MDELRKTGKNKLTETSQRAARAIPPSVSIEWPGGSAHFGLRQQIASDDGAFECRATSGPSTHRSKKAVSHPVCHRSL